MLHADRIINCGDAGQEGELIQRWVIQSTGARCPVQRLWVSSLTEEAIREGFANLKDATEYQSLYEAGLSRAIGDWLLGMNATRLYTLKYGQDRQVLSIGRVQTPTLALIVNRYWEITNFKPQQYWVLSTLYRGVTFTATQGKYESEEKGQEDLQNIVGKPFTVTDITTKKGKEAPPRLFDLTSLQVECNKKYSFSADQTLQLIQSLYEKKLTTYPRSDCDYLPENQFTEAKQILVSIKAIPREDISSLVEQADTSIRSRAWNDKKISAHHAIIPTRIAPDFGTLSDCEQNLYCMVAQAYLAQFFPVHTYLSTVIRMEYMGEQFAGKGRTVTEIGWKAVYRKQSLEETEKEPEPTLPVVSEGDEVEYLEGRISEKTTKAPSRFTPATLLKAMKEIHKYVLDVNLRAELKECSGIGTEATRAGIIEKLQSSGFLALSKKYLLPTDKANLAVKILPESLTYPDTTAVWEKELEDVDKGAMTLEDFSRKQEQSLSGLLEQAKTVTITASPKAVLCPKCGKPMRRRKGKNGFFWGCTGYPGCSATAPDNHGKPDFSGKGRTRKK